MKSEFISKIILKLIVYTVIPYVLLCCALTVIYVNQENEKYSLLTSQIAKTLRPFAMVKDEIAIRRFVDKFIEETHILKINIRLNNAINILEEKKVEESISSNSFFGTLLNSILKYEKDYLLYPNSTEKFRIKLLYQNNVRSGILFWSLLISIVGILFSLLIFYRESKKMISKELHEVEIENEKNKFAERIFHQIKSDALQIENLIDSEKENISTQTKILLRGIRNTLLKGAERFMSSDKKLDTENELKSVLVRDFLSDVVERKNVEYKKKLSSPIQYAFHGPDDLKINVCYDKLMAACSELINNAVDAIESEKCGYIIVQSSITNNVATIFIKDNGCGIPSEELENIFIYKYSYGKVKGNGIGLTHASELIKSMDGDIEIESNVENGTTVKIHFLIHEAPTNLSSSRKEKFDAVYIDDSLMSLLNAKKKASLNGKALMTLRNFEEYFEAIDNNTLTKDIPLFTDSDLGQEFFGEDYAKKAYHDYGVESIFIVTGDPDKFKEIEMPWIKEVIAKENFQNLVN